MGGQSRHIYEFGPFFLDSAEQLLLCDGRPVPLKPRVFNLLLFLVENGGRLLDKDLLLRQLWPNSFVEEGNLAVGIFELRKALGDDTGKPFYIETIPRRGYRFAAPVRRAPDNSAEATDGYAESGRRGVDPDRKSIAVLPFKHIGARPGSEYLGLGMADALITRLSNVKQITVRPTSTVRRYKNEDAVGAGRQLRVQSVLDGSIQESGGRIRVTVQLVNVQDGASLWAEKFDQQFTDVFALEDSISEQVAKALTVRMSAGERRSLTKRYTEDPRAHRAYLKGRYFWNKRTPEGLKKGVKYFEQAIEMDPEYALAYTGLADCYIHLESYHVRRPKESLLKAKEAALKALELDDTLAEAHASLGFLLLTEWEWTASEAAIRQAIEINPNSATAHHFYALHLRVHGRFDEALAEVKKAQEIDPLSLAIETAVGGILYFAREYDRAVEGLRVAIESEPGFPNAYLYSGLCYEGKGLYGEAIAAFRKKMSISGREPETLSCLAHAYARAGRKSSARRLLDELGRSSRRDVFYYMATVRVALGEYEQAFAWLERGYEELDMSLALLNVDPRLDPLRADPRFSDLLRRVGFAVQQRLSGR
ncbi:MAG TPA: tetratricopeptide repeat protein [Blastocatellia bacterium]|nr:tetratricopeptide repeat protein [Blastocatellia bacterium]